VTVVAPAELAKRPQWVAWRLVAREGEAKPTKVPYAPRTGRLASTTDPSTWASFEEAAAFCTSNEWASGVGYVLSADDPYVGIDLDACRDPKTGHLQPWARSIVKRLNSYTEISPSGTGLRIFVRGELPPHGRRKGHIEIYSQARFLTITGDRYLVAPDTIYARPQELLEWHHEVFGDPPERRQNGHSLRSPVQLADADLLLKARSADNGAAFWALWNGDYSAYGSQSEADLALVSHLAFWCGPDPARIDQLFRSSGLMRDKWDRQDYRDRTIDKALDGRSDADFYRGEGATSSPPLIIGDINPITGEVVESPWQSLAELVSNKPDHQVEIVQGLLWAGRTHWFYSAPGVGKTLFTIAMLMHVADETRETFCGRTIEHGPVLLIEEDSPLNLLAEYISMVAEVYGFDLATLPFWVNRTQGIRITSPELGASISMAMTAAPQYPKVLALDACERIVPSEKFSSKELEPLSSLLQKNVAQGIANIVIDHTRKSPTTATNQDPLDLLYGGRSKSAISDVMIHFSGTIKTQARLTFTKFRGQTPPALDVSFNDADGFKLKGKPREFTETERRIMEITNNAFGKWVTRDELEERSKLSTASLRRACAFLLECGYLERAEERQPARFRSSGAGPGMFHE
jgi:putative DNA primase/helicase